MQHPKTNPAETLKKILECQNAFGGLCQNITGHPGAILSIEADEEGAVIVRYSMDEDKTNRVYTWTIQNHGIIY